MKVKTVIFGRESKMLSQLPGTQFARNISGRVPTQNPGSDTAMSKIREWVYACDHQHKSCAPFSVDQPLPKRILNIENKPVVWETKGATGRYAALSYCWGKSGKNILLTKDKGTAGHSPTFDEFTTVGIEMDRLAKTIQDSILVCRALGLKYLWVDALCIVQEERGSDDFKVEAPRMSEYYSNAYITIIAGSAKDCADGFLNERPEPKVAPCLISYSGRVPKQSTSGHVKLSLPTSQDNGPIEERAWTFQERMMSKRYLLYGPDQFHFRCKQRIVFEDGDFHTISAPGDDWRSHLNFVGSNIDSRHTDASIHDLMEHNDKEEADWQSYAYFIWSQAIAPYTRREMSKSLDKLAAIAGYANYFEQIISSKYMYGLWEIYLCDGLLWTAQLPLPDKRTYVSRAKDRAPSWSWASIDGPVYSRRSNPNEVERLEAEKSRRLTILRRDNVPGSFDPLRDTNAGPDAFKIVVRGNIRQVWSSPWFYRRKYIQVSLLEKKIFDFQDVAEFQKREIQDKLKEERIALGAWDSHDDYKSQLDWESPVYTLPIYELSNDEQLGRGLAGLLLSQVDSHIYKRIGYFMFGKKEFWNHLSPQEITLI